MATKKRKPIVVVPETIFGEEGDDRQGQVLPDHELDDLDFTLADEAEEIEEVEVPEREDAELSEDDLDFDEDDLQEMFANLGKIEGGELDF